MRKRAAICTILASFAFLMAACSSGIEESHPTGADVSVLGVGVPHSQVLATLGPPAQTYKSNEKTVDIYSLDPDGPSRSTKSTIETVDVVADVLTLGLSEIVATPLEYATKHAPTNYVVTYSSDDKVESVATGGR
jgi:hypothetical protein